MSGRVCKLQTYSPARPSDSKKSSSFFFANADQQAFSFLLAVSSLARSPPPGRGGSVLGLFVCESPPPPPFRSFGPLCFAVWSSSFSTHCRRRRRRRLHFRAALVQQQHAVLYERLSQTKECRENKLSSSSSSSSSAMKLRGGGGIKMRGERTEEKTQRRRASSFSSCPSKNLVWGRMPTRPRTGFSGQFWRGFYSLTKIVKCPPYLAMSWHPLSLCILHKSSSRQRRYAALTSSQEDKSSNSCSFSLNHLFFHVHCADVRLSGNVNSKTQLWRVKDNYYINFSHCCCVSAPFLLGCSGSFLSLPPPPSS